MTTDFQEPLTQIRPAEQINYQDHFRKGEKGKPELTQAGKDYADGLYYGQVMGSLDPHDKAADVLDKQKDVMPQTEYNLLRKHMETRLRTVDDEKKLLDEVHEGRSVWTDAFTEATKGANDNGVTEGRFAHTVIRARKDIDRTLRMTFTANGISGSYIPVNRDFREILAANEAADALKNKSADDTRSTAEIVQDVVQETKKAMVFKEEQVNGLLAEQITKPKELTRSEKVQKWVDTAINKVPVKVRRTVLVGTVVATMGVALSGSVAQPTQKSEIGGRPESARAGYVVEAVQNKNNERPNPGNKDLPGNQEKQVGHTSVVYTGAAKSEHEASFNTAGFDEGGVVKVTPDSMSSYIADGIDAAKKDPKILAGNRTLSQLTLPYTTDSIARGIGSKFSNGEAGLGFTKDNYGVSTVDAMNQDTTKQVLKKDGNILRGIVIGDAGDPKASVEALVRDALIQSGKSPEDPSFKTDLDRLTSQALGDLGVTYDAEGNLITNQARLTQPDSKGHQDEVLEEVKVTKDLETPDNATEEETDTNIDAKNSLAITGLVELDNDGNIVRLRVEGYSAAAVSDAINQEMNAKLQAKDVKTSVIQKVRAALDRLLPKGQQVVKTENKTTTTTTITETPPPTTTPVPPTETPVPPTKPPVVPPTQPPATQPPATQPPAEQPVVLQNPGNMMEVGMSPFGGTVGSSNSSSEPTDNDPGPEPPGSLHNMM